MFDIYKTVLKCRNVSYLLATSEQKCIKEEMFTFITLEYVAFWFGSKVGQKTGLKQA